MGLKILLDTPAVERLLGGNTDAEVELRQCIVEEFAKKHLKKLWNDSAWSKVYQDWKKEAERQIASYLKDATDRADRLNPEWHTDNGYGLAGKIENAVRGYIEDAVKKVSEQQATLWSRTLTNKIHEAVTKEITSVVREVVKDQVTKLVEEAVAAKLDSLRKLLGEKS